MSAFEKCAFPLDHLNGRSDAGAKAIKEIARELKISRNTVRETLRSGEISSSYEREAQPRPKLVAIAIARSCIRAGSRGRFFNTVDLVNRLEAESRSGRLGRLADYLTRLDFIILDELGYLHGESHGAFF
jgi:hypothetical protein